MLMFLKNTNSARLSKNKDFFFQIAQNHGFSNFDFLFLYREKERQM